MDCPEIREKLSASLDNALSPMEERVVTEHLSSCENCKAYSAKLKKTKAVLNDLDIIEAPPWLTQRIMASIQEEAERQRHGILSRLFRPLSIKIPLQAFALLFVIGLTVLLYRANTPEIQEMETTKATKSRGLEQPLRNPEASRPNGVEVDAARKVAQPPRQQERAIASLPETGKAPVTEPSEQRQRAKSLVGGEKTAEYSTEPKEETDYRPAPSSVKQKEVLRETAPPEAGRDEDLKDSRSGSYPSPAVRNALPMRTRLRVSVKSKDIEATTRQIEGLLERAEAVNLTKTSAAAACVITSEVKSETIVTLFAELKDRFGATTPAGVVPTGQTVALTIDISNNLNSEH